MSMCAHIYIYIFSCVLLFSISAGKTTTLSMLTGEVHPTKGYSVIAQHDSRTEMREAFECMG